MDKLFSIKMRASAAGKHVSGAEKIVPESALPACSDALLKRALLHAKGKPDFVNVKCEEVAPEEILRLKSLPVSTLPAASPEEGLASMETLLRDLGVPDPHAVVRVLLEFCQGMRGAILLDVDSMERLEPDQARGVRATRMDDAQSAAKPFSTLKNHYAEAIVLATKVAHAPRILGEICISDDPDYATGYVASKRFGYVRIERLKPMGSPLGGRVFLYRGPKELVSETVEFLEKRHVLVEDVPELRRPLVRKSKWSRIESTLAELKEKNLHRSEIVLESAQSAHVVHQGRSLLMLASNDYLDLANEPCVRRAAADAALAFGSGSGGSRLTTGTLTLHRDLERLLADFKGADDAIVFDTGYMANVGTVSAVVGPDDVVFSDELNHASIIDGCRLSKAKIVVYRHNDMDDLERKIRENPCGSGLVVSDAVFSMDGDVVDLPRLVETANRHGLLSMIDEAHASGVLGAAGRGVVEHFGETCRPDILMGTLSKAFGSSGGFVCGSDPLVDFLRNKARSYIFSTSLSPADLAAAAAAVRFVMEHPERVRSLQRAVRVFCDALRVNGIDARSETPIIPIHVGDEARAVRISQRLFDQGILINAIRYPTVAKGSARLRAALMATHVDDDLRDAARAVADALSEIP